MSKKKRLAIDKAYKALDEGHAKITSARVKLSEAIQLLDKEGENNDNGRG